ncbi:NAD-dependent epimerase/dehydratase family protein [Fictibacillus terranigra]|uniref:NAD-dependent epimerase/dehydratase family protein n=1 Tax=Fictibacillus terranigra TaxID=3058424 RepID=A0ABT8E7V8_9BACL|nr:NAD-dependent epimerase/dehydratase family protein [Fictibacillus sp. CENA-BCM004]MDN4074008.1 NAD-dependent epimerase/dehydratase family protein [Fictibacillus sp. CENA-BCM004]
MSKKVILAGGSGFLGESLARFLLKKSYKVIILSRKPTRSENGLRYVQWDGQQIGEWSAEMDGSYAVINFTGKSVNCIYTKKNRQEIVSSRLDSVKVLREAVKQ